MDWSDTVIKIAVGACLGFGIIALARLTRKKDGQGGGADVQAGAVRKNSSGSPDGGGAP